MFLRRFLLLALLCLAFEARAESSLDLQSWLDRPGVRAVVVEFYATWCEPCMKAMPRWKALKEKYGKDGLRVIVVNTRDEDDPGKCVSLGWTPDALICDTEGVIDERFGVKGKLPSAFLWSWEHKLLVQRGHVMEVEGAVEKLFAALPRVEITAEGADKDVVEDVTAAINYSAKMRVVASEAEREKLRKMRLAQQNAHVSDDSRCETGKEVAPNSSLVVSLAKDRSIKLKLIDLESGCVTQNSAGATARDAVENLIGKLRVPLEWPSAGKRTTPAPAATVASAGLGTLLVTSDVEGAEISIDGRPQGVSAGRKEASFSLPPGRKQVKVSKAGYLDDVQTIELRADDRARVSAHLEPESKASAPAAMEGGTSAFLTITSDPKSAVITLDGKKVGKTPRTVDVAPGKHRVSLSLEWYAEVATDVTVADGATQKLDLKLVPDFGEVEVSTTPAQTTVFLDGRQVGTADPTLSLPRVTLGKHVVKVIRTDFHDAEVSIDVVAGKKLSVKVPPLKPSVGSLRIVSEPPGARVSVDGRDAGRSPITVERLSDGPHAVKVTLDDYDDWEGSASVVEGKEREFKVSLESLRGTVQLNSEPSGQPVLVDGEAKGTTPAKLSLLEGEHRVRVGAPGAAYAVREERVTVVRGQNRKLDWTLEAQFGRLVVMTDPPEATVILDGKELGASPQVVPKLAAGEHRVEVKLKGHESASQTVRVEVNKEAKVRLELAGFEQPEFSAQPSSADGKCPAGMVYIAGGTFNMGSNDGDSDERPVHRVTLSAFCLDRTEHAERDGMPTVNVDWDTAKATCEREGKRLPTEAEWEFAARGTQGRKHPWGNSPPTCAKANYDDCGSAVKRVGSLPAGATPEGVQDLAGNVWEWVADCYGSYSSSPQNNPSIEQNACQGSRVDRGGGCNFDASSVRASLRSGNGPRYRNNNLGFRCARGTSR